MRRLPKLPEHLRIDVARCAHAIWCHHMLEQGWTPGERFDATARVHDALKPFDKLTPFRRDLIAEWLEFDGIPGDLRRAVESALADDELSATDVDVGTLVRLSRHDPAPPIETKDDYLGRIVECVSRRPEFDRLELIKVIWPDGQIMEYGPTELEVAEPAT